MSRRSRADVGLYAPRVTRRADHIPNRGPRTPSAGGGNPYVENWTNLTLDPTDNYWHVVKSGNANTSDDTITLDGDILSVKFGGSSNRRFRIQGSENNGINLIKKTHMNWYSEAGIQIPNGAQAHWFEPETFIYKMEVQFDTSTGPVQRAVEGDPRGSSLGITAGFLAYTSDQSGSPTVGGTGPKWFGAAMYKNFNSPTSTDVRGNMFKVGYRGYHTNGVWGDGNQWQGMANSDSTMIDTLVFATCPIRNGSTGTATDSTFTCQTGGYASGDVRGRCTSQNFAYSKQGSTIQQRYVHPAILFGCNNANNVSRGEIRIKRIRYCIQPILNRSTL